MNSKEHMTKLKDNLTYIEDKLKHICTYISVIEKEIDNSKTPSHYGQPYVTHLGKILVLDTDGVTLVNDKDCNERHHIDNYCLANYQTIKLKRVLNKKGWFMTPNVSMDGIPVMEMYDSKLWKIYNGDFIPDMAARYVEMADEINELFLTEEMRYIIKNNSSGMDFKEVDAIKDAVRQEVNMIIDLYSEHQPLPNELLEGKI